MANLRTGALVAGLLALALAPVMAAGSDPAALFAEANDLYEAGRFGEAASKYEACLQAGAKGADVYFNLGNAHASQKQAGRALAAYDAALRISPRDADVRANVQQIAALKTEGTPQIPRSWMATAWAGLVGRFTLNELTALSLLLLVVCTGLGGAALLEAWRPHRLLAMLACAGALWLLVTGMAASRYARDFAHAPSYVCAAVTSMRSGPGEHFEDSGTLGDGAAVEALGTSGGWTEVLLASGKRAWVRSGDVVAPG